VKRIYLLFGLLFSFWGCNQSGSGDELEISMPVSVQEIKPGSIEEIISTTATVNAIKNTVIYSEVEGRYRLLTNKKTGKFFAPGDKISNGELVIILDNPEYENNIKIESQKLNLDISKREFEKQKSLYDKGGVTLRELKNSERTLIEAQYTYENALFQLQKLRIGAPFSGTIIDLPYHTQNTRIPVNQVLMELMDYDRLYAEVFYPAKELDRIQIGQKLRVTHYSLSKDTLRGEITQVSPALNPDTRSFKAQILVDNFQHFLRPGMFVKVETIISQKDSVIVIPKDLILSKRRGKTVYVVDKGAAFRRIVTTGIENAEQVEILEGLKEKDRLVIKGFETLRNRSKVKIVK
jgi:membrane fusion protein, multidrug efflux system